MNTLTPEQLKQLEQLKDITLPEPIGWWPLAIGWWLLIGFATLTVIALGIGWWRQHTQLRRLALTELNNITEQTLNNMDFVTALSALLKRVAIQRDGEIVATISGDAWQTWLHQNGAMQATLAHCIAHAPYNEKLADDIDRDALLKATKNWIRRNA